MLYEPDNLERTRGVIHAGLAGVVLVVGVVAFVWLVETKPAPATQNRFDRPLEVAVKTILPAVEQTPVVGHGTVRPKSQISIVPQISGTLTYVYPELAQGRVVPKGTLLFQIDKTIYDARVRQAEAEIKGLEAGLARHDQETANLDAQLETAGPMLAIDENDYATSRKLYEVEKVGTQRDLDLVHQKYLRQKSAFVELESKRSMIPHLQLETQAQLEAARARLQQTRHDLEATTITCPFEARVESIGVHESQFVTAHLSIATLTDMGAFEISVGIDPRELRWLDRSIRPEALGAYPNPGVNLSPRIHAGWTPPDMNVGAPGVNVGAPEATVRWTLHGQEFSWTGRVTRFERVDEATRTARMVVEVRQIDMVAKTSGAGESGPALSIGMFCKTELPAAPLQDSLAVPRHAIYDNEWVYVFVADGDASDGRSGRLERRRVPMLRSIRDEVLVNYRGRDETEPCELAPGDRVVVSPLTKPVVGMKIRLRDDDVASAQGAYRNPGVNLSPRIHAGWTPPDMNVGAPGVSTHPPTETRPELIAALAAAGRDGGGR